MLLSMLLTFQRVLAGFIITHIAVKTKQMNVATKRGKPIFETSKRLIDAPEVNSCTFIP